MIETTILKEVIIPEATIRLKNDGIVYVKFVKDVELDIELQMKLYHLYNDFTEGKLTPFLFEAEDGVTITKEARDNAASLEDTSMLKVTAVVVKNTAHALIANFYMTFNKPKRPYKVFSKKDEAVAWLKQYV